MDLICRWPNSGFNWISVFSSWISVFNWISETKFSLQTKWCKWDERMKWKIFQVKFFIESVIDFLWKNNSWITVFNSWISVFNWISETKFSLQLNFRDQIQSSTEFQSPTEFGRWPNSVFKRNDVNEMKDWKWKIFEVTFLIESRLIFFKNIKFFEGLDMSMAKFSLQLNFSLQQLNLVFNWISETKFSLQQLISVFNRICSMTKFSLQSKWCEWDERMKVKNIPSRVTISKILSSNHFGRRRNSVGETSTGYFTEIPIITKNVLSSFLIWKYKIMFVESAQN
jgi:hypothetical protein